MDPGGVNGLLLSNELFLLTIFHGLACHEHSSWKCPVITMLRATLNKLKTKTPEALLSQMLTILWNGISHDRF